MDDTPWQQINIAYPGATALERERRAILHLEQALPAVETAGLISAWWFIRKGHWRLRYQPTPGPGHHKLSRDLLSDTVNTTDGIYEPETHAFGGTSSMNTAHTLFHQDSRHLLTYLRQQPTNRREHSLILCTTLMNAAALDLNEQGDVWAKVAEQRNGHFKPPPDTQTWESFTGLVRQLILGAPRNPTTWHTAFANAGTNLRELHDTGQLSRGIRAVLALHVIFHWNRIGLPTTTQATLAQAAQLAIFGSSYN